MTDLEEFVDNSFWLETNDDTLEEESSSDLPKKSKNKYTLKYKQFNEWCNTKFNTNTITEDILLEYFKEVSEKNVPNTLYSIYSILKTMILKEKKFDISSYNELKKFLSEKSKGFKRKKTEYFTAQNVSDFINNAPDEKYLVAKVVLIFGVAGACHSCELKSIRFKDVEEHGQLFRVSIPLNRTEISRSFIVNESFYPVVKQYLNKRPPLELFPTPIQDFFLHYKDGKCIPTQMGKNAISSVTKVVAKYLKLPNPENYTGHCFRQTSIKIRANKSIGFQDLLIDKKLIDLSPYLSTIKDSSQFQPYNDQQEIDPYVRENEAGHSNYNNKARKRIISTQNYSNGSDENYVAVTKKSKTKNIDSYEEFFNWKKSTGMEDINENTLLAYFTILSNKLEPNALLEIYSTIKTMLWKKEKINIKQYDQLNLFLKHNCDYSEQSEQEVPRDFQVTQNFVDDASTENILPLNSEMSDSEDCNDDFTPFKDKFPSVKTKVYMNKYKAFVDWRSGIGFNTTNEKILLDYFAKLSTSYSPSTLYCIYYMLKTVLKEKEQIDISSFEQLNLFLKQKCDRHEPKRIERLTAKNIRDFINSAPDEKYLATKVVLIFGISGACKVLELKSIRTTDVVEHGRLLRVNVPRNKTEISRTFIINEEFYPIVKRYIDKRPQPEKFATPVEDFFIHYKNGKCTTQQIGKNILGAIPRMVAQYLKLPNADSYIGFSSRRKRAKLNESLINQDLLIDDESHDFIPDPLYLPTDENPSNFENFIIKEEISSSESESKESIEDKLINDELVNNSENDAIPFKETKRTETEDVNAYKEFSDWRKTMGIKQTGENTLLAYFAFLSHKIESNTLLNSYTIIKKILWDKEQINIKDYDILNLFLNQCGKNFEKEHEGTDNAYLDSDYSIIMADEKSPDGSEISDSEKNDDDDWSPMESSEENKICKNKPKTICKDGYKNFIEWREATGMKNTDEKTLLNYFENISLKFTPSTLYKIYSLIKTVVMEKEKIDIGLFTELKSFLRIKTNNYEPVKAEAFTLENIRDFINNAPDVKYLLSKVILIFGISGACKTSELKLIRIQDVKTHGNIYCVNIPISKKKKSRKFIVGEEFYPIVKRYMDFRPPRNIFKDFFLNFQNGRCLKNPVGRNKIANTPKEIAKYLELPNADKFTSSSFRETSANMESGIKINIIQSKEHEEDGKSFAVEENIDDPLQNTELEENIEDPLQNTSEGSSKDSLLKFESYFVKEEKAGSEDSENED